MANTISSMITQIILAKNQLHSFEEHKEGKEAIAKIEVLKDELKNGFSSQKEFGIKMIDLLRPLSE